MGNSIPTFRGKAQDPSLLVQTSMETLEILAYQDEAIMGSWKVAIWLPSQRTDINPLPTNVENMVSSQ